MKWYILLLLFICFGCVAGVVSENSHYKTPYDNYRERMGISGLSLGLKVEPLVIEPGETIHIELTVANNSSETIVKHFSSGCIYGYSIDGIAQRPSACTMEAPIIRWEPGEIVVRKFTWEWNDTRIVPGSYWVSAGFGKRGRNESSPSINIQLK